MFPHRLQQHGLIAVRDVRLLLEIAKLLFQLLCTWYVGHLRLLHFCAVRCVDQIGSLHVCPRCSQSLNPSLHGTVKTLRIPSAGGSSRQILNREPPTNRSSGTLTAYVLCSAWTPDFRSLLINAQIHIIRQIPAIARQGRDGSNAVRGLWPKVHHSRSRRAPVSLPSLKCAYGVPELICTT